MNLDSALFAYKSDRGLLALVDNGDNTYTVIDGDTSTVYTHADLYFFQHNNTHEGKMLADYINLKFQASDETTVDYRDAGAGRPNTESIEGHADADTNDAEAVADAAAATAATPVVEDVTEAPVEAESVPSDATVAPADAPDVTEVTQ